MTEHRLEEPKNTPSYYHLLVIKLEILAPKLLIGDAKWLLIQVAPVRY